VYRTDILEDDLTVAGLSRSHSTSRPRAPTPTGSWRLIDVYPDQYPGENGSTENALGAYQQIVRGDVIRGKSARASKR